MNPTHILIEGLVLEPGDKVLIAIREPLDDIAATTELRECLQEFHPDVQFIILNGAQLARVE